MNHRSGGDRWYSAVIDSCRRGCLDLDDWRFLHGAPTTCCGSWLTASKTSICGDEKCADFSRATAKVRDLSAKEWQQRVGERNAPFECVVCQEHRRQRCRVYQPLSEDYLVLQCNLGATLRSARFRAALYITRCNEPAASYALQRTVHFAVTSNAQVLWVQAENYLDDVHFAEMSAEEKLEKKSAWLRSNYHAKRTGDVPSLLPLVYNLPMRMLGGNYGAEHSSLKARGVHNQGRCVLKGWELHEGDMALVQGSQVGGVVLQKLPKRIAVLVSQKEEEDKLEDHVDNYVWLPAVTTTWWLDSAKCVEVNRRGFAIVPDFASTVHSATGRTLEAAIPDLGAFKDKPNFPLAMEGMIALSRVKWKENVVIARPFPPGLFQQGPAVYPTLLLEVLQGKVRACELFARLKQAEADVDEMQSQGSGALLKNMTHECGSCGEVLSMRHFVQGAVGQEKWYAAVEKEVFLQGVCATCLSCKKSQTETGLFRCVECKELKTAEAFGRSKGSLEVTISSKHRERIMCLQCLYPACENEACPRCPSCLEESCSSKGHCRKTPNQQKQRKLKSWRRGEQKKGIFRCSGCELRLCKSCEQEKCTRDFPTDSRRERCKECEHPACTNPRCRTCKSCRDPLCKDSKCALQPKALHPKTLASIKEVSMYECEGCFFPACANEQCRKPMSA